MIAVGHVQTHNIHAGSGHLFKHRIRRRCRPDGTNDFGLSHSQCARDLKARYLTALIDACGKVGYRS